ncbi:hypothetical protein RO3G_09148 [Rhizopus delemar RA 99-880]|uniref:Uncharacterized protein n=1 Tax=Rhizopus delemar (strain RA 99-880 / ATCC MYA-4621 / FGSC 9543 / NRRL 43880) TaxID=246409 RepID=I1C7K8_RHIO9|nr:hypothetical protein RO3G_09148 [Rhizopus delemar RA 99-880]|eukprot:EIE84438.1 hypothetical protein RO3G_09148 [Rhizopus delemar RA 99-880]
MSEEDYVVKVWDNIIEDILERINYQSSGI